MSKQTYFSRQANRFTKENLEWCSGYVKKQWPEETAHILRIAEEVSKNYFLFDLPWDMERTFEPVTYGEKIDWDYIPFGDPEYVFQLCRHRFFICLGQAYQLTGDEKYAEAFVRFVDDWIENVPLTEESEGTTWRTIETGIRGETWTKAVLYFENSPALTDEFMDRFEACLRVKGEYLLRSHSPFRISSNWGVLENAGLYLIGSALDDDKFREAAWAHLEEEAEIQVMGDGVHWEQSPMYHNEVLHCFMEAARQIKAEGKELPPFLHDAILNMGMADLAWKKPNHRQFAGGDSDATDLRDMLCHSAYLVSSGVLKFGAYEKLDFESAWEFGREAAESYEKLEAAAPEQTDWMLEESGNYYLRSSWGEDGEILHFRDGALGGGHGHFDKLHVDLVMNGEDVLIDGGRCTYVFGEKRSGLKSAKTHNTVVVDDKDYMECDGSWGVSHTVPEVRQKVCEKDGYTMVQGGHLGYLQDGMDVYCQRKVIRLEQGLYLIADSFYSGSAHTYSRSFHFAPEGTMELEDNRVVFQGRKVRADLLMLGENETVEKADSICSRYYNQWEENPAVQVKKEADGFTTMYTVISETKQGEEPVQGERRPAYRLLFGTELPAKEAESIWIKKADREYLVVFRHKDLMGRTDLVGDGTNERKSLGKTTIYRNQEKGTVIEW